MMKKWFGCLFVLLLLCCVLTTRAEAETVNSGTCGPDLTWSLDSEGTLTISGTGPMYDYTYQYKGVHITIYITNGGPWGWETVNKVIIEPGVTYIGENAFRSNFSEFADDFESGISHWRCKINITSIEIPDTVTGVGENAFFGNNAICNTYDNGQYVKVGNNPYALLVDTVNTSITSCQIHEDTEIITGKAFESCNALTNIFIPAGVTSVGSEAFKECDSLTGIQVAAENPYYCTDEKGVLFDKNKTQLLKAPVDLTGAYQIPDGVRTVQNSAFEQCRELTSVVIPDSVTELGEEAFYQCTGLQQATIGDGVTEMKRATFWGCSSLQQIVIPSSVNYIGEAVFHGCISLESMTIPFVGDCRKTADELMQYPFGYLFGTSWYSGATATKQYYHQNLNGTRYTTYYIPNSLRSVKVTGGGVLYGAFYDCTNLTSIMITDGVTEIAEDAFYNCKSLTYHVYNNAKYLGTAETPCLALIQCTSIDITSYTIPEDTKIIAAAAFKNCGNLTNVTLPEGLKRISGFAFEGKNKLSETRIPAGVDFIGMGAFKGCGSLERIVIPNGVTDIRKAAFEGCSGLVEVVFPSSIQKIDASAFSGCSSLAEINLSDSIISIGESAFSGCSSLAALHLPDSITSIGESAFSGCSSLAALHLPDGIISIGESAFSGCSRLTEVIVPDSVTSIGEAAFSGCSGLQSITIPFVGDRRKTASETYQYTFGYIFGSTSYTGGTVTAQHYYDSRLDSTYGRNYCIPTNLKSVTVTGGEILRGAFYNCRNLTGITLPEDITEIGATVFYYCSSLTDIVIPAGVTKIGDSAFYSCNKLGAVEIPEGVTDISRRMFYSCTGLREIVIHEGIVSIGEEAFLGCSKLSGFVVSEDNPVFSSDADGLLLNKEKTTIICAPGGLAGSYTVPDYITTIDRDAFRNCKLLTEVIVPDSVTTIGSAAFSGCSKLQSLTIPFVGKCRKTETDTYQYPLGYPFGQRDTDGGEETRQIYYGSSTSSSSGSTFFIPSSLTSVTVTGGEILYGAFYNCKNLESITIPGDITKIGDSAFYGCNGLKTLYYTGTKQRWEAIKIGDQNEPLWMAEVICVESQITGIRIQTAPTKQEYFIGEELDLSGLVVQALLMDGTDEVIANGYTVSGYDATTLGVQTITVSYENFAATFTVCVKNGGNCGENLNWSLSNDGTLTITGTGAMTDFTNSEAVSWYPLRDRVKKVVIKEGVTTIGNYAFSYCENLSGITIASTVTAIGSYAFERTHALQYVRLPSGLQTMGSYLFYRSEGLRSIVIPNRVTSLGASAFSRCINLKEVTIGIGVTKLERYTFYTCTSLTSVIVPDNITAMGDQVFENCSALTTITLSVKLNSIGKKSFSGCTALKDVHYANTDAQWAKITIGESNEPLLNATLHMKKELTLVITDQPQDVLAQIGDTVVIQVKAEGAGLQYKWQYSSDGVKWYNTTLTGNNTDTLIVADVVSSYDNRRFRCVITAADGSTTTSNTAKLRVFGLTKNSATVFGAPVNTDHVFSVVCTPTEGVTYQWQYKGNTSASVWSNTGLPGNKTPNLTVTALDTRNGYQYRCIIRCEDREIVSKTAILYVKTEKATIYQQPVATGAVCGDYAIFQVEASGVGMQYQWQWYHEETGVWVDTKIAGYHTETLRVKTNNYNGGRLYRCRLRTVNGSGWNEVYTEPVMMTVLPAAEISQQPQNVTVKAGQTATFHVEAEGEGLTYQWQWAKYPGNWKNTTASGNTTDTLTIAGVSDEMGGRYYRVIITNRYGGTYTTDYAQLFVEE